MTDCGLCSEPADVHLEIEVIKRVPRVDHEDIVTKPIEGDFCSWHAKELRAKHTQPHGDDGVEREVTVLTRTLGSGSGED